MTSISLIIKAEALSDWSIRTGHGLSKQIDSAITRDSTGLPYIPAKSIVGVLRQQAKLIAESLDAEAGGTQWSQWLTYLFGSRPDTQRRTSSQASHRESPVAAHLHTTALRMTTAVHAAEVANSIGVSVPELHKAVTVIRTSTAIDEDTKTAEDASLRVDERARAGYELEAKWALNTPDDSSVEDVWPALFLLASALHTTYHVGGKRTRGAGEFKFTAEFDKSLHRHLSESGESVLDWLLTGAGINDSHVANPPSVPAPTNPAQPESAGTSPATETGDFRKVGTLYLSTVSPLIVGPRKKGTVVTSSSYIPGATLLSLVQRCLGISAKDIRNGKCVVTNAYPTVATDTPQRCVPWPLALARKKGKEHGDVHNKFAPHVFDPKLKPVPGRFVTLDRAEAMDDSLPTMSEVAVPKTAHTHVSLKPGQDPELFEYRAIDAGVTFAAEVWWTATPDEGTFPAQARVGTSHKDDYGLVDVEFVANNDANKLPAPAIEADSEFTVLLTSDALLTAGDGSPAPTATALLSELEAKLGLPTGTLTVAKERKGTDDENSDTVTQTLIATVARHDSWQVSWGLPRPTLIGLSAGSVVRIHTREKIDSSAQDRLNSGIGSRTAEGFGRVALNPELLEHPTLQVSHGSSSYRLPSHGAENTVVPAQTQAIILRSILLNRLSQIAMIDQATLRNFLPAGTTITNTQLNQLRELSQQPVGDTQTCALQDWLLDNNFSSAASRELEKLLIPDSNFKKAHRALEVMDSVGGSDKFIYEHSSAALLEKYADLEASLGKPEAGTHLLKAIIETIIMRLVKSVQKNESRG